MALLVALRLVIGLHFFSEGAKHHADPQWSPEAFVRAAKGPFAPLYQWVLADFHRWNEIFYAPPAAAPPGDHRDAGQPADRAGKAARPSAEVLDRSIADDWQQVAAERAKKFADAVVQDWKDQAGEVARFYGFADQQKTAAQEALNRRQSELELWLDEHEGDLAEHVHTWRRAQAADEQPSAGDVPYQKGRIQDKRLSVRGQANAWIGELKKIERGYEQDLQRLLTDDQDQRGDMPRPLTPVRKVGTLATYWICTVGGLLLVGLLTRVAALAGAAFLLSVVSMQPFWLADAEPTIYQFVELFALLALSALPTGRWGGLDYFLGQLFSRRRAAGGDRT